MSSSNHNRNLDLSESSDLCQPTKRQKIEQSAPQPDTTMSEPNANPSPPDALRFAALDVQEIDHEEKIAEMPDQWTRVRKGHGNAEDQSQEEKSQEDQPAAKTKWDRLGELRDSIRQTKLDLIHIASNVDLMRRDLWDLKGHAETQEMLLGEYMMEMSSENEGEGEVEVGEEEMEIESGGE